jgi:hypothetical protein
MNGPGPTGKKLLRNVGGSCLIVVGVAGLFLPFLQGILLILAGVAMLDFEGKEEMIERLRESPPAQRVIGWWRRLRARRGDRGA